MPYEGHNVTNENSRKMVAFDRKLEGHSCPFCSYFDEYQSVMINLFLNKEFFKYKVNRVSQS